MGLANRRSEQLRISYALGHQDEGPRGQSQPGYRFTFDAGSRITWEKRIF